MYGTNGQITNNDLGLAKRAALAAREVLWAKAEALRVLESRCDREWKIAADRYAEEAIIALLQKESDYWILSEECGVLEGKSSMRWVIDPVDGSANFHRNVPLHCISVGLWKENEPILGVTLDIVRNDLVFGVVGVGAWHNDQPIYVSSVSEPSKAVLSTGYPAAFKNTTESAVRAAEVHARFGKVRMLGTAALMMTWVARGLFDCYWERRIALWDIAAGAALIKAAGGVVKLESLTSDHRVDVKAACNPTILAATSDNYTD